MLNINQFGTLILETVTLNLGCPKKKTAILDLGERVGREYIVCKYVAVVAMAWFHQTNKSEENQLSE